MDAGACGARRSPRPARPFAVAASCRMSHSSPEQTLQVVGRRAHLLHREDVDVAPGEPLAHPLRKAARTPLTLTVATPEHAFEVRGLRRRRTGSSPTLAVAG